MSFRGMKSGFTLIEILVVVAIMSIIAVSGLSSIINLQRTARVNEAQSRFTIFLDLARSYAINGKLVKCTGGNTDCMPKSYGAVIRKPNSNECPGSTQVAELFYLKPEALNFEYNTSNVVAMDSFCINPKNFIEPASIDNKPFYYSPPFGTFTTESSQSKTQAIILTFCDNPSAKTTCEGSIYKKNITLYPNVGVPE